MSKKDAYLLECELLGTVPTDPGFRAFSERYEPYDTSKMLLDGGVKFYRDGDLTIGFPGETFSGFVEYNVTEQCMSTLGCTSEDRAVIRGWRVRPCS